jgi:hypothetical protein
MSSSSIMNNGVMTLVPVVGNSFSTETTTGGASTEGAMVELTNRPNSSVA